MLMLMLTLVDEQPTKEEYRCGDLSVNILRGIVVFSKEESSCRAVFSGRIISGERI